MRKYFSSAKKLIMKYPNGCALLFGITVVCAVLAIFEITHSFFKRPHEIFKGGYPDDFLITDSNLGYKAKADKKVRAKKLGPSGSVIFDVVYSTDSKGRRVTPVDNIGDRDRFLVFFGCSVTFGYGLDNNETLPFYLCNIASSYKPYNEALVGYGPQHMLALLEDQSFDETIDEKEGIVLCIGIWVHRAVPSNVLHSPRHNGFPYYYINESGDLIRNGSFRSGRFLYTTLLNLVRSSAIAKYSGLRKYLAKLTDQDIEVAARIVIESSRLVKTHFNNAVFYVVIPPGMTECNEQLVSRLHCAGINILDYSGYFSLSAPKFRIPDDGHPTAEYNRLLAELIARDLRLTSKK